MHDLFRVVELTLSPLDTPGISDLSADAVALISGSVDGTLSEGSGFGILPHPSGKLGAIITIVFDKIDYSSEIHCCAGVWYYVPHRPHGLAPHVVAIVMDMSLPSFQDLLDVVCCILAHLPVCVLLFDVLHLFHLFRTCTPTRIGALRYPS